MLTKSAHEFSSSQIIKHQFDSKGYGCLECVSTAFATTITCYEFCRIFDFHRPLDGIGIRSCDRQRPVVFPFCSVGQAMGATAGIGCRSCSGLSIFPTWFLVVALVALRNKN